MIHFIFRADKTNTGDWWSLPTRYFGFEEFKVWDILALPRNFDREDILIIGGGGLGADYFWKELEILKKYPNIKIIWGAGVDTFNTALDANKRKTRPTTITSENVDLYGSYFDFANIIGLRVYPPKPGHYYVPCPSCMHPLFDIFRQKNPQHQLGIYQHKRVPINVTQKTLPKISNEGKNIFDKIAFISSCSAIITNTYHGAYWGALLNRKVILLPFKSGLFGLKYKPYLLFNREINLDVLEQATAYPHALEESRTINKKFYKLLIEKFL